MNILLTGANGYIGQRLIPVLVRQGHTLYCCVRDLSRFEAEHKNENIIPLKIDFLQPDPAFEFPPTIDISFYLIHSMSSGKGFQQKEAASATCFSELIQKTTCKQVIYLSGIVNESTLSHHLQSRLAVEHILRSGKIPATILRAGIIVGSGSASFEIIRDLVEKLPVMITPKWVNTLCQPIAIRNVIQFLTGVIGKRFTFNKNFDIGGPEVLSYKQMMLLFAQVRGLKRHIITLPVMTPKLSSYWLYFITSTSYPLAINLVDSMKVPVICRKNNMAQQLGISLVPYTEAVEMAFQKIEQHSVVSSWKDAFSSSNIAPTIMNYVEVPSFGCFKDVHWKEIKVSDEKVLANIWSIGGLKGWYYATPLWRIRGFLDKTVGGVGLRRGRTHTTQIYPGDALDFWRVLIADKPSQRLLLFAEMKLPGEAWLEFKIVQKGNKTGLEQTATFRPKGLWGRLYWYAMLPFHYFIFNGMISNLVKG